VPARGGTPGWDARSRPCRPAKEEEDRAGATVPMVRSRPGPAFRETLSASSAAAATTRHPFYPPSLPPPETEPPASATPAQPAHAPRCRRQTQQSPVQMARNVAPGTTGVPVWGTTVLIYTAGGEGATIGICLRKGFRKSETLPCARQSSRDVTPSRMANFTSSASVVAPTLAIMLRRWVDTVRVVMLSRAAICLGV